MDVTAHLVVIVLKDNCINRAGLETFLKLVINKNLQFFSSHLHINIQFTVVNFRSFYFNL